MKYNLSRLVHLGFKIFHATIITQVIAVIYRELAPLLRSNIPPERIVEMIETDGFSHLTPQYSLMPMVIAAVGVNLHRGL